MGVLDAFFGRKQRGPGRVRGTAQVIAATRPPHAATHGNVSATLVVELPGTPAYQTAYSKLVCRVSKWPSPGRSLPVSVDPRNLHDVEVLWDEVPTGDELGRQQAAAVVDHLNALGPDAAGRSPTDDVVSRIQQMFPGAQVHVEGSAPAPPAGPAPPPQTSVVASQSSGDPVVRLEKLAQLRDAGVVTQEQFEQLRAQILDQAGLD